MFIKSLYQRQEITGELQLLFGFCFVLPFYEHFKNAFYPPVYEEKLENMTHRSSGAGN